MPVRNAEATWDGSLHDGEGSVALGSGAFEGPYSFGSRFEDDPGTNPEELIGAAHAGCFSMALALGLSEAGYEPNRIHTEASVRLDADALEITDVTLDVEGVVPGVDESTFVEHAEEAKNACPVSKALAGADISMTATLTG